MKTSRKAVTSARTPASAKTAAGKPAAAAPGAGTRLSAAGAFALNACFVAGLLVLSQLSLLQQRPTVRASIVGAALLLLAWSGLLFFVLSILGSALPGRRLLRRRGRMACNDLGILLSEHCDQGWPDTCEVR